MTTFSLTHRSYWLIALLVAACGHSPVQPLVPTAAMGDNAALVARGEYLVRTVASCGGCHGVDHKSDGPLAGGAEFKDWRVGTIRAANLTPDSTTGLGTWSDVDVVRALRNGQARDGHLLAPVMPYGWLNGLSDRDALAIARYLASQLPALNEVHDQPNLIFKFARSTFLGPVHGTTVSAPPAGPTAEYGGYLAQHAGLCADCHTPRGGLQDAPDKSRLFAGDAHPSKDFPANPSNLTADSATGIGKWSEADFIQTIRTGVNPQGDSLNAFMPWRQNRRMTDDDLRAIYRYLRSLPQIHNVVPSHR